MLDSSPRLHAGRDGDTACGKSSAGQRRLVVAIEAGGPDIVQRIRNAFPAARVTIVDGAGGDAQETAPVPVPAGGNAPSLTARQAQILPMVLEGKSNKLIARELALSHFTVRNHVTMIFHAHGVKSRPALRAKLRAVASSH